ncbi:AMP-binding protein [Mycobacteroides franklinii]|uniref:AMP-binding protein n=1 Tax=Mycobacteroides franklinii TaxID=948102 RepID=UPI0013E8ACF8|nr:long-chain fatty acid--CoA ligase [Mycobacteroides franklinii]
MSLSPSAHECRLTESYWPADRSVSLIACTVGDLLRLRAVECPNREAVVGIRQGDGALIRLTYGELLDEALRVAAALARLVEPGDFVALWAPNVVEWTIIQYGAALAGVVLVALNPVLRESELDYALRHCKAALLLHADTCRDYNMAEVATRVCAGIPGVLRVSLSDTEMWRSTTADPEAARRAPENSQLPVMLQYTSGTSGRPKAVLLTHQALVNVAKFTMEAVGVQESAVCVNPLPLFHTAGCVIATLGPLWLGGTAVICERFEPAALLMTLRVESAEVLFYVPAVLDALLMHQRASGHEPPSPRIMLGGASTVSPDLIDGAASTFNANVVNVYGQTELASVVAATRPTDDRHDQLFSVGRPLPHVDCKIIDPATGEVLAVDQVGEICVRGYQQFVEYLHDPEASARARDPEGFVRTGDLGAMDARGFLTVVGRLKELIIRGGENIAPADIESVVSQHDRIAEVIAVGLPDKRLGEIAAVVCRVTSGPLNGLKDSLVEHARASLSPFKVPQRWFVTESFPVTPTGKVQRFAIRDAIVNGELPEL